MVHTIEHENETTHALTILNQEQIRRIAARIMDPNEFLSDYGVRSLSKAHGEQPFLFDGQAVGYEPAEAISKLKGGNSNWRGPLWFPTSFLLIESLRKLGKAFGGGDVTGGITPGVPFNHMAREISERMIATFARDKDGRRAGLRRLREVPGRPSLARQLACIYEYFHGDTGAGLGASHQTGWTALIASLIDEWRY